MIDLTNNNFLVECLSDLPDLPLTIEKLYLDLETSSHDQSKDSLNPWKRENCSAHLFAITWDQHSKCYAVPRDLGIHFVATALSRSQKWVNQNVKYDAHVCYNDLAISFSGEYCDTLTLSKLVDSDRTYKGGYGLDALSKDYIGVDLSHYYNSLRPWLRDTKGRICNRDYGCVPDHVLGEYACAQVQANRKLHAKLEEILPAETRPVWETEKKLTTVLVKMERQGMLIDVQGVQVALMKCLHKQLRLREELEKMIGYPFNPKSNPDCYDLFINQWGLPEGFEEKREERVTKDASFASPILKDYLRLVAEDGVVSQLLEKTLECRHQSTMQTLFWEPWLKLHVNGILHSDNNQNVRSGRMSCSMPNNQQFNDEARALIIPRPGYSLSVHDYSQIEYRFIVHYIGNKAAIEAYHKNPSMDWHQHIADELGIPRSPAKTLNFALCYGMGKAKTIKRVTYNRDFVKIYKGNPDMLEHAALECYRLLHERLPELKYQTKRAEGAARLRGYVRNAYGRRLHLPLEFSYVAFNRVCQSHAADLIKERAVALHEELPNYSASILALVHDEVVSEVPTELAEEYTAKATEVLNQSGVPVRVPIRCSNGVSAQNWLQAKKGGDEDDAESRPSEDDAEPADLL